MLKTGCWFDARDAVGFVRALQRLSVSALAAFLAACGSDATEPTSSAETGGLGAAPVGAVGGAVPGGASGGTGAVGVAAATGGDTVAVGSGAVPGAGGMAATGGLATTGAAGMVATGGATAATGGALGVDPFSLPATCTSGTFWTTGEGQQMRPGEACIACHASQREGPTFAAAGTVYSTGHEPDDCNGAGRSGAVVVITDAQGTEYRLDVNQAGNFMLEVATLALPYTAKVVVGGTERAMGAAQNSGDCNSCHTEQGASSAPGRIVLP